MSDRDLVTEKIAEQIDPADILHLGSEMAQLRDDRGEPSWFSQISILSDRFRVAL